MIFSWIKFSVPKHSMIEKSVTFSTTADTQWLLWSGKNGISLNCIRYEKTGIKVIVLQNLFFYWFFNMLFNKVLFSVCSKCYTFLYNKTLVYNIQVIVCKSISFVRLTFFSNQKEFLTYIKQSKRGLVPPLTWFKVKFEIKF